MSKKNKDRQIVIVNQAANYLTVGFCNAFSKRFDHITLITANVHEQGEKLNSSVNIEKINKWAEHPPSKKIKEYLKACVRIYRLLIFKYRKHDVFFVSTPPMAYLLTIILPNRCSMLIWDVYPDVLKITGMKHTHPVYKVWSSLNRIAFKKAKKIFTIGNRMAGLLEQYTEREEIFITPIWSIFQDNGKVKKSDNPFLEKEGLQNNFIVQYSGNIGLTHNVEVMIELADMMREHEDVLFQIIGRGSRVPHLKKLVEQKNLPNCQFLPFQSDKMFPYSLSAADIGVVVLDETTAKGSVPSKSYNLMSFGIPSLYIAADDSELSDYALKYEHAKCINHDNLKEAVDFILKLYKDRDEYNRISFNALKAAGNYKRSNADRLVDLYIEGGRKLVTERNRNLI